MTAPSSVGQRLKAERERLGIGRVAVTRATGILVHDLAALEFGRYEDLPDNVIEPWIRAYARHVGLDPDEIAAELRRERGTPETAPAPVELAPPAPPRTRIPLALAIGAPALLVALVAAWWGMKGGTEHATPKIAAAAPQASPVPSPPPAPSPSPPPPPSPSPSPTPRPPRVSSLTIAEHGVGSGIADHRLTGASDAFPAGTEVWFWTDVRGGVAGETVRHVWLHDGGTVQSVSLRVGAPRWRTQSSLVLPPGSEGDWSVEARDDDGNVLAQDAFRCAK